MSWFGTPATTAAEEEGEEGDGEGVIIMIGGLAVGDVYLLHCVSLVTRIKKTVRNATQKFHDINRNNVRNFRAEKTGPDTTFQNKTGSGCKKNHWIRIG